MRVCACEVWSRNSQPFPRKAAQTCLPMSRIVRSRRTTHPWRHEWPKLRDNHQILWLGHHIPCIHHLPWPGDRPGRPSWPLRGAPVRSRTLHRHTRPVDAVVGAPRRLWWPRLRGDRRVLRLDHRLLCEGHLPWPWEWSERPLWSYITHANER